VREMSIHIVMKRTVYS